MTTPGSITPQRRLTTETKAAYKTTELIAYVVTVIAVLVASAVVDDPGRDITGFSAKDAWLYVTILTSAYVISRGLAKSGSRERYDESYDEANIH